MKHEGARSSTLEVPLNQHLTSISVPEDDSLIQDSQPIYEERKGEIFQFGGQDFITGEIDLDETVASEAGLGEALRQILDETGNPPSEREIKSLFKGIQREKELLHLAIEDNPFYGVSRKIDAIMDRHQGHPSQTTLALALSAPDLSLTPEREAVFVLNGLISHMRSSDPTSPIRVASYGSRLKGRDSGDMDLLVEIGTKPQIESAGQFLKANPLSWGHTLNMADPLGLAHDGESRFGGQVVYSNITGDGGLPTKIADIMTTSTFDHHATEKGIMPDSLFHSGFVIKGESKYLLMAEIKPGEERVRYFLKVFQHLPKSDQKYQFIFLDSKKPNTFTMADVGFLFKKVKEKSIAATKQGKKWTVGQRIDPRITDGIQEQIKSLDNGSGYEPEVYKVGNGYYEKSPPLTSDHNLPEILRLVISGEKYVSIVQAERILRSYLKRPQEKGNLDILISRMKFEAAWTKGLPLEKLGTVQPFMNEKVYTGWVFEQIHNILGAQVLQSYKRKYTLAKNLETILGMSEESPQTLELIQQIDLFKIGQMNLGIENETSFTELLGESPDLPERLSNLIEILTLYPEVEWDDTYKDIRLDRYPQLQSMDTKKRLARRRIPLYLLPPSDRGAIVSLRYRDHLGKDQRRPFHPLGVMEAMSPQEYETGLRELNEALEAEIASLGDWGWGPRSMYKR